MLYIIILEGGEPCDQAAAQLQLQAGRLHLPQHPVHRLLRMASLHHLVGARADGHHLPPHQGGRPLDQQSLPGLPYTHISHSLSSWCRLSLGASRCIFHRRLSGGAERGTDRGSTSNWSLFTLPPSRRRRIR